MFCELSDMGSCRAIYILERVVNRELPNMSHVGEAWDGIPMNHLLNTRGVEKILVKAMKVSFNILFIEMRYPR